MRSEGFMFSEAAGSAPAAVQDVAAWAFKPEAAGQFFSRCRSTSIGEPGGSLKGFGEIVQIILLLFRIVILDNSCFFL